MASNRTVRASSAIAAGSTRWLVRRTKRPLSASLEEWPVLAATPTFFISVAGQLATRPVMASHGQSWPVMSSSQLAHCYALVKNLSRFKLVS
jgi:hypothetical protein